MNIPEEKATVVEAALKIVPPIMRKNFLTDPEFIANYGLEVSATISLGSINNSIESSRFYDAIRAFLGGNTAIMLTDSEGEDWHLINGNDEGEFPKLVLSSGDRKLVLPYCTVLSEDVAMRIRSLEKIASDINLPSSDFDKWKNILQNRALKDDEMEPFHNEINDTPVSMGRTIRREIESGKTQAPSIIPNSKRYFERLVGAYDGSSLVKDYAIGTGREFLNSLAEWNPYDGFLHSLLLSSHSTLTNEIKVNDLNDEELVRAYQFIEKYGDPISRLGAFEVGLMILRERPEVEPFLLPLVRLIKDDNVEDATSETKLYTSLFILVDGELARTHLLAKEPPFYRRLASLTHAALIHRQLIQSRVDHSNFLQWALNYGGEFHHMQSLVDMRNEPRWYPSLVAASHIQADFLGRVIVAGNDFSMDIDEGELRDIVVGDGEKSLSKQYEFPIHLFPGPLEGGEENRSIIPDEYKSIIDDQLNADTVNASSFTALISSALFFAVNADHAKLAAEIIRKENYRLNNLENELELSGVLNGLAIISAMSRNSTLADDLRILVRRYRHDPQYSLNMEDTVRVCLMASAAHKDLDKWRDFVGEWLTELAFSDLKKEEGELLYLRLLTMLHLVPELWFSSSKAEAALEAFCSANII